MRAFVDGKLLQERTVQTMLTPHTLTNGEPSTYGLGFYVRTVRGREFIYHGGNIFGWRGMIVLVPSKDIFCAVLTNRDDERNQVARLATGAAALAAGR